MSFARRLGILSAFSFLSTSAFAGWVITSKTVSSGSAPGGSVVSYVSEWGQRTESNATVKGKSFQSAYVCNADSGKTFTLMNGKKIEMPGGGAPGYKAAMDEQLAKLPPDKRAKYEEMMKQGRSQMGKFMKSEIHKQAKIEKVGGTFKIGQWNTTKYEQKNEKGVTEFYVTTDSVVKLSSKEQAAHQKCAEMAKKQADDVKKMYEISTADKESPFPKGSWIVKMVSPMGTMEVVSIESKQLSKDLFE